MSEQQSLANDGRAGIDLLLDVPLQLSVELGRKTMTVAEVLKLGRGSVVELSKASGEPLDIYVNDRLVARGEAVMVGERYGIRISEVQPAGESNVVDGGAVGAAAQRAGSGEGVEH